MSRNPWEELLDIQLDTTTVCAILVGGLLALGFLCLCIYAACTAVCQPKYLRRRQEERRTRVKKYRRRNRVSSVSIPCPTPGADPTPGANPTPHRRRDRFACAADDPPGPEDDTDRRTETISEADVNTVGMSARGRSKAAKKSKKKQKEGGNESVDKRRQRSKSLGDGTIRARGDKGRQRSVSEGAQVVMVGEGAERLSCISGSTVSGGERVRQRSLSGGSSQSGVSAQGRTRSVSIERQKSVPAGGTPQNSPLGRERLRSYSGAGGSMARLRYARRLSLNAEKAKREMKMKRKKPPKRRTTRNLQAKVEFVDEKEGGAVQEGTQGGARSHREGAPKTSQLPSGAERKESDGSPVKSRDDATTEETDLERSSSSLAGLQDSRGAVGGAATAAEMTEYASPVKRKGPSRKCESSV